MSADDDLSVFDDGNVGLGADGLLHDDPACATLAPLGSFEARWGEPCSLCLDRKGAPRTMQGTAHRGNEPHAEDDWCLQMLCKPIA